MTSPPVTPSNCTIKMSRDPSLLIPEMFIHTCGFISSISDLLNFREALGERDLVIPVDSESTDSPPESKRHSTMDYSTKLFQFQQVAEEIVLSQCPSLKPLQKTMENKARWLKIGRFLHARDQKDSGVWDLIIEFEKQAALQEMTHLKTLYCREFYALIAETMTSVAMECCSHGHVNLVRAIFLHPVLGQWIFFEFVHTLEGYKYFFQFPPVLCREPGEQVEFFFDGPPSMEETRELWDYLTSTSVQELALCQSNHYAEAEEEDVVHVPPEESEKLKNLISIWRPIESPFNRFSLLADEMYSDEHDDQSTSAVEPRDEEMQDGEDSVQVHEE